MTALALALALAAAKPASGPDCASWPTSMSLVHLKNAGRIDPTQIDPSRTKAVLMASERLGKRLFRQVYDISFYAKSGRKTEVVTDSEASVEECSVSGVTVYIVSDKIGGP